MVIFTFAQRKVSRVNKESCAHITYLCGVIKIGFLVSYGGNRMLFLLFMRCHWRRGLAISVSVFSEQLQMVLAVKPNMTNTIVVHAFRLFHIIFLIIFFAVSSGTGERTAKQRSFQFTIHRDTLNTKPSDMFYFASFLCQLPE